MHTPIIRWRAEVAAGNLQHDPAQERACELLTILHGRLQDWRPGKRRKLFGRPEPEPEGVYLYGGVGRGKSMLMDMFFDTVAFTKKRRVHFHEFMLQTHKALNHWRKLSAQERRAHPNYVRGAGDDPLPPIAKGIARDAWLLCFDEMRVTDITDAMILSRLFEHLFSHGVIIVSTSNRHPDELYKDGLNRERFLPFINMLCDRLEIHALEAKRDYRLNKLGTETLYFSPLNSLTTDNMDRLWTSLTMGVEQQSRNIALEGRVWQITQTAGGIARLSFAQACQEARGPADYLALANQFHTIILEDIPILDDHYSAAAKRFITFIDALYEHRVKLIASADAAPEKLYQAAATTTDGFEFKRTISRLLEMQSTSYIAAGHGTEGLII